MQAGNIPLHVVLFYAPVFKIEQKAISPAIKIDWSAGFTLNTPMETVLQYHTKRDLSQISGDLKKFQRAGIFNVENFLNLDLTSSVSGLTLDYVSNIRRTIKHHYRCASTGQNIIDIITKFKDDMGLEPAEPKQLTEMQLPFKGRDDIIELCITHFQMILFSDSYDKTRRPLLHCIAAPGLGKSRLVMELINSMTMKLANKVARTEQDDNLLKLLRNSVSVLVSMANGLSPISEDFDHPLQALLYRLLYMHFINGLVIFTFVTLH